MPWSRAPCANRPLQSPEGKVIGRCVPRHWYQEFIRFIATVERSVPAGKVIHVVLDNYAAHKPSGAGLARRTSVMDIPLHTKLTRQSLKRGVFRSFDGLESAITLHRRHQQESQALRLDRDRKNHSGQAHAEPSV